MSSRRVHRAVVEVVGEEPDRGLLRRWVTEAAWTTTSGKVSHDPAASRPRRRRGSRQRNGKITREVVPAATLDRAANKAARCGQ